MPGAEDTAMEVGLPRNPCGGWEEGSGIRLTEGGGDIQVTAGSRTGQVKAIRYDKLLSREELEKGPTHSTPLKQSAPGRRGGHLPS